MKRFLTRASVAGLSAALVAGAAFVAAPAASAAPIGTLSFNGLSTQDSAFSVTTSGACPTTPTLATNFLIRITGGNLPVVTPAANITGNTAGSTVGGINAGPFTGSASNTLRNFASDQGLAQLGNGTYTIELVCRQALQSASLGEFVGTFNVNGNTVTPVVPAVSTSTSITSASPAAGATNAPATFTATVSPSNASGTVQFTVDGVNLGAPVAVSGGTATSPATGLLAAGNRTVVANFVGGSGFTNSTSAPFIYSVAAVTASSTTNLALSAATVAYPGTVTATATVTSGGAPVTGGTVQFTVDGANLGSPVALNASGVASSPAISRNAGTYTVSAVYSGTSAGGATVTGSTSPDATFEVTAAQFDPDVQNIQTSIAPGTLVISTPYTPTAPLVLPAMTLNTSATEYSTSAAFQDIIVTDTRPGNLPWTVSAIASDLTKFGVPTPSANETIDAQNVGLTNLALGTTNATPNTFGNAAAGSPSLPLPTNFTGFDNPAAAHVAAGSGGNAGLGGSPKPVLHANKGLGTTTTNGTLTITAPTNTLDGTYNGIITFTILGS
jgi:hypothetical protein